MFESVGGKLFWLRGYNSDEGYNLLIENKNKIKERNMDSKEFRKRGYEMVDYIVDYLDTIESRRVTPSIEPGYLRKLLPTEAPQKPEDWNVIMDDVEKKIMPGMF
ncbi:hypothetical protein Anas_12258 [Armadillidium nasatum]|uniref:Uncharacterized protein n=1 Tax=Armadillidium nasatum TaxID=96803 RepID=A0A5N5SRZ0_9CRUS|nr:hypothetical protein Anas_12258 [Armadillidium nasatum]